MEKILKKVSLILEELSCRNKSMLIALSGGIDSMTLLSILNQLKTKYSLKLSAAYVNHNLRGIESKKEEKFVEKYLKKINMPLFFHEVKKTCWHNLKNDSVEMAARKIRYTFFKKTVDENKIDLIALAHNFNDRIETYFLNLFRAGGINTLRAIKIKNKNIIRPLLTTTRSEIEKFAKINKIPYFTDSTNKKNIYKRNIIRNKLIPLFRKIHPEFEKSFTHVFQFINEEQKAMSLLSAKLYKKIVLHEDSSKICISREKYFIMPIAVQKYTVKLILKKLKLINFLSLNLLKAVTGGKKKYKKKELLFINNKFLWFINQKKINILKKNIIIDKIPFKYNDKKISINIRYKQKVIPQKKFTAKINKQLPPVTIRNFSNKDEIYISRKNKKKISEILKDKKIPGILFDEAVIIEDKRKNIIGFIFDDFYRVSYSYYLDKKNKSGLEFNIKFLRVS